MPNEMCPLCALTALVTGPDAQNLTQVTCRRCGKFHVRSLPLESDNQWQRLKPYLSVYVRMCTESVREPQVLDSSNLHQLAETFMHATVPDKLDYLLRLLAKRTAFFGQHFQLDAGVDYPAVAAVNIPECQTLFKALDDLQYIVGAPDYYISVKGWEHLDRRADPQMSGRCFVAMSFDPSLSAAYESGIMLAIAQDTGHFPIRIDRIPHNDKICDRILAEIRQSQFVVADVTLQKPGVYFEAGFAMALQLPVIWTCRQDDFQNVHFDTRQYNHIVWTAPDNLRDQLRDRILATIGNRSDLRRRLAN